MKNALIKSLDIEKDVELVKLCVKKNVDYIISKSWFVEWKKKSPGFKDICTRPDSVLYRSGVYCEHGDVSICASNQQEIPRVLYQILQSRYSEFQAPSVDAEKCPVCESVEKEKQQERNGEKEQTELKATMLKILLTNKPMYVIEDQTLNIISSSFIVAMPLL